MLHSVAWLFSSVWWIGHTPGLQDSLMARQPLVIQATLEVHGRDQQSGCTDIKSYSFGISRLRMPVLL